MDLKWLAIVGFLLAVLDFSGKSQDLEQYLDHWRIALASKVKEVIRWWYEFDKTEHDGQEERKSLIERCLGEVLKILLLIVGPIIVSYTMLGAVLSGEAFSTGSSGGYDGLYAGKMALVDSLASTFFGAIFNVLAILYGLACFLSLAVLGVVVLACFLLWPIVKILEFVDRGPSGTLGSIGLMLAALDLFGPLVF